MIELSENECLTIVKKATRRENVKVVNFSTKQFGNFLGFLGEYYRLTVNARVNEEDAKEFQFFIKSLPIIDMRNRREMLIESGIFRKEMDIYRELLQNFVEMSIDDEVWCPTAYLIRKDLIVFNDLRLQGYDLVDFGDYNFPQEHVEATLKSLANFHACSILYEKVENATIGDKFKDILFETSVKDDPWFLSGLDVVKKIAKDEFGIDNSEIFYKKIKSIIDIMESSPFDVPKVLCHRDLWRNNLMFREKPLHCILIDFQTCRYLSLSVDVTMAIICTTSREHYEKKLEYYLQFYYQQLQENLLKYSIDLKSLMSYEEYVNSCEYHKKVSLVYKTFVVTLTQVPRELFKNFTTKDYNEFAEGDRYSLVKKFMEQDEALRSRLIDAVDAVVKVFHYQK